MCVDLVASLTVRSRRLKDVAWITVGQSGVTLGAVPTQIGFPSVSIPRTAYASVVHPWFGMILIGSGLVRTSPGMWGMLRIVDETK